MDKINYSDKPHYVATSGTCGLYRNPMLCERLAGRMGILLKQKEKQEEIINGNSLWIENFKVHKNITKLDRDRIYEDLFRKLGV